MVILSPGLTLSEVSKSLPRGIIKEALILHVGLARVRTEQEFRAVAVREAAVEGRKEGQR